jgi:HSP20 family protein
VSKRVDNSLIQELLGMKKRMDALYAESFMDSGEVPGTPDADATAADWEPPADVWETAEHWTGVVELPGVAEDDLQLEVSNNLLTVKGQRKPSWPEHGVQVTRRERPTGYFSRSLALPESVAADRIRAEFKQGLLTIEVPKNSGSPRKILVRSD